MLDVRMRELNNKEGLIIYISAKERINKNIKQQIEDLKKKYEKITIFIGGDNSIESVLNIMIQAKR